MINLLKTATMQQKICIFLFFALSIGYLCLEVFFNLLIFDQMSTMTSKLEIQQIEQMGKTFTGIGLCLILLKFALPLFTKLWQFVLAFIALGLVCIGVSFFVQNQVIDWIVDSSSEEQQGKALLISQASGTIVPFYDDYRATEYAGLKWWEFKVRAKAKLEGHHVIINPEMDADHVARKESILRDHYFSVASQCVKTPNSFGVTTALDKAFFPYIQLSKPFAEDGYKQAVMKFTECLIEDPKLYKQYVSDPMNQELITIFGTYESYSNQYKSAMNDVLAEEKKGGHRFIIQTKRQKIQEKWNTEILNFGPGVYIPPLMTQDQFFNNAAVKSHIFNTTKQNVVFKPNQPEMKAEFIQSMPNKLFKTYDAYRHFIPELGQVEPKAERIFMGQEIDAKRAYKAIVMPMVALSFSIFFLILNILSLISLIFFSNSPKLSRIFMIGTICLLLILPMVKSAQVGSTVGNEAKGSFSQYVIKTMYFYQSAILKIYSNK